MPYRVRRVVVYLSLSPSFHQAIFTLARAACTAPPTHTCMCPTCCRLHPRRGRPDGAVLNLRSGHVIGLDLLRVPRSERDAVQDVCLQAEREGLGEGEPGREGLAADPRPAGSCQVAAGADAGAGSCLEPRGAVEVVSCALAAAPFSTLCTPLLTHTPLCPMLSLQWYNPTPP